MTDRTYRRSVAAAVVVGLGLRIAWVAWASRAPTGPNSFLLDPVRYLGYGDQIARGHGMVEGITGAPTAYYPPGYPWFVGIVDWISSPITDQAWLAVACVQAMLGAATVALGSLRLSALQVAVAMAVSSGALGLEAAVVYGPDAADEAGTAAVHDVAPDAPVHTVTA